MGPSWLDYPGTHSLCLLFSWGSFSHSAEALVPRGSCRFDLQTLAAEYMHLWGKWWESLPWALESCREEDVWMSGLRQWPFLVASALSTNCKFPQWGQSVSWTQGPSFLNPDIRACGVSLNNFGFMVMSLGAAAVLYPEFSFISLL